MKIKDHLDKNNLHHAYLIEGRREEVLPEILEFIQSLGVKSGNADFVEIHTDSFKIEDARNLKSYGVEKSVSSNKKIYVISANNFLLEAQQALLKMFEEPVLDTHFFLIVPNINSLLKTLVSRFYVIHSGEGILPEIEDAKKFVSMPIALRLEFIKELLVEEEDGEYEIVLNSTRAKALKFLNALESVLHGSYFGNSSGLLQPKAGTFPVRDFQSSCLQHIFKVREFLRMPGSSAKMLLESVALVVPEKLI
jgi:hypothetical protein